MLTLDKVVGEGAPPPKEKQNLHGVGRLMCPEGLIHWPSRIGPQAPARKADSLVGGALDR